METFRAEIETFRATSLEFKRRVGNWTERNTEKKQQHRQKSTGVRERVAEELWKSALITK